MVFGVCRSMRDRPAERSGGGVKGRPGRVPAIRNARPRTLPLVVRWDGDSERISGRILKKRLIVYGGSHRNTGYDLARRRADFGSVVYRAREAEHRASVARRTACRPDRGSLGPGFRRRVRVGAAYRPLGRGTAVFSTGWRFWVSSTAEFRCGGSPMPDAA